MSKRLKIGVDVDGVCVDFCAAFFDEAKRVLGRQIRGVQTSWDFEDSLNISKEEVKAVWKNIASTDNWFFEKPMALPLVAELIPWLTEAHETYFITSRSKTSGFSPQKQTQMYLGELGVEFPTVIANRPKGLVANALGLDAFVDDYIKNIKDVQTNSPDTKLFLMEHSYNKNEIGNWTHIKSFKEFIENIEALSNE